MTVRCEICGLENQKAIEEHHIVPRRYGGSDEEANLVNLCASCHSAIEKIYDDKFYQVLGVGKDSKNNKPVMMFEGIDSKKHLELNRVYAVVRGDSARIDRLIKIYSQPDKSGESEIDVFRGDLERKRIESDEVEDKYRSLKYQFKNEISIQRSANTPTLRLNIGLSGDVGENLPDTYDDFKKRIKDIKIARSTRNIQRLIDGDVLYRVSFDAKISDYISPHEIQDGRIIGSALRRISNFDEIKSDSLDSS